MTSVTDLRDVVDTVIGVDTHVQTHSAAVVDARTGGVLEEITVEATTDGYARLVEFANEHAALRAWAIEGTGGHGAGLTRHLERNQEVVVELDRPERAKRRNGAKSDPLDAIRAAREALSRAKLGTPRSGGDRQALSVLLAARRSAVNASTDAQRQLFSLLIAAPEPIRERFRGQKVPAMIRTAAKMRLNSTWDLETTTTVRTLRALARRARALSKEAAEHENAIRAIVLAWRPEESRVPATVYVGGPCQVGSQRRERCARPSQRWCGSAVLRVARLILLRRSRLGGVGEFHLREGHRCAGSCAYERVGSWCVHPASIWQHVASIQ